MKASGSIKVIDTSTNTVTATVLGVGGSTSDGLAFTPDGTKAYVAKDNPAGSDAVSVLDTSPNGSFLKVTAPGSLVSTTTDPLVSMSGTWTIGNLFDIKGSTVDATTGLGTDKPLQTGGKLFEATAGATINVTGNALRVDKALLEASAPIISMIGTTTPPNTTLTTSGSTMELIRSNVTSLGPVVSLDKAKITVSSGSLVNLTQGSRLTVTGDLLSLANGSQINVLNGPLIKLAGLAPTGISPAAATLTVTGALVSFAGTGSNTISLTNGLCPCTSFSGIPVALTGGALASNVSITNPIKNPSLGSIVLSNPTTAAGGTAVIQVDGSASKVTISGQ